MNRLLENYEGILLHAHAGRDGGKIADIFTLSAGLVRIYVGKTVLERCGSGGMVSFTFLRFTAQRDGEIFFMSQYESRMLLDMMRLSYEEMQCWYYVIELVNEFFPKEERNEKAYRLLGHAMTVAAHRNKKGAALIVSVQLLRVAGIDAGSDETERELRLSVAGMKLMQSFSSYDWGSEWETPIKASVFKELAGYIDKFILQYGEVKMKTAGAFLIEV